MSRKPDREGVQYLREVAKNFISLSREVTEMEKVASLLPRKREELAAIGREITNALEKMDCSSSVNFGWEGRIGWMICELVRQEGEADGHEDDLVS